jgi:hypothetical protein
LGGLIVGHALEVTQHNRRAVLLRQPGDLFMEDAMLVLVEARRRIGFYGFSQLHRAAFPSGAPRGGPARLPRRTAGDLVEPGTE